ILTVGQHTDHIENGQRVSRYSLPTPCFLFFFPPAFFKNNFSKPALAHWLLPQPHKPTLRQKPKSQFC
ncbi:MAG: hypothetical protein ACKO96_30680, partial [Flammeovirgaceae bacterium]